MNPRLLLHAFALAGLPLFPSALRAETDPWIIAQQDDLVGRGKPDACVPFAFDLSSRFLFTRTGASVLVFDWIIPEGKRGRHAMVVFRDNAGRLWGVDNLRQKPMWLAGEDPKSWTSQFMPHARTRLVSTVPNAYAKEALALGNPATAPATYEGATGAPRSWETLGR